MICLPLPGILLQTNASDPIKLLMHFDNNFIDESTYNRTFTVANGTPNFVTNAKFGTHAYKMSDGYGVYHNITCSHDSGLDTVSLKNEWQIDFWLNLLDIVDDGSNDTYIIRKNSISNSQTSVSTSIAWAIVVSKNIDVRLDFRYLHNGATGHTSASSSLNALNTNNVWHHCRIVSNGTAIKVFVNGISGTSHTIVSTGIISTIYDFFIGVREGQFGGYQAHAIMDELQIKSGFDSFDDFVSPNTLTLVLLHFNGTNGSTIFTNSSVIEYNFVNDNALISSTEIVTGFGSTGFFNNSGGSPFRKIESVNIAPDLRNTDFTIECFIHPTALNFSLCEIFGAQRSNSDLCYACYLNQSTSTVATSVFGTQITHQTTISLNTTYHIALVRHNNNFIIYLNGVASNTSHTISQLIIDAYSPTSTLKIGVARTGIAAHFTGYIDEFRIRKEAVYLNDFTPPVAPFDF